MVGVVCEGASSQNGEPRAGPRVEVADRDGSLGTRRLEWRERAMPGWLAFQLGCLVR